MKKILAWWQARVQREALARLDERSLKDIGLESWNGAYAERLHAYRQRRLLRLTAARIGAY